ncbi:MAG TPA: sporulation peptidase YabG [Desulfotomaculum sp.]|nr:MAG: Sporulation peptidase YabG [Desulfotomaculum sp. 46_80]KUK85314.1 MAG: Sporulation peptidase YabG [Desulfofundulus kuznetsovii]HAG10570.1 sporulation peptidase YabG [Desulfotomaculum sp.]HBY03461.1 sporulation peptidase YabG [Desulfotomaculum sp.]
MEKIKPGDIVGRISYGCDIFFKVIEIFTSPDGNEYARLRGIDMRLMANSPLGDLCKFEASKVAEYLRAFMANNHEHMKRVFARRQNEQVEKLNRIVNQPNKIESFDLPGSVLHIDGDEDYLELCLTTYRQLSISANGYFISEELQSQEVEKLLRKHIPDILVITGHDGLVKGARDFTDLKNYHSSAQFIDSVRIAREFERNKDDLVIFAGACQSHYDAILDAGANFASSPERVLIHAFDPVFVVEKIAYTSIYDPISLKDIINGTITGFPGIGGIETRGKYRMGIPRSPY